MWIGRPGNSVLVAVVTVMYCFRLRFVGPDRRRLAGAGMWVPPLKKRAGLNSLWADTGYWGSFLGSLGWSAVLGLSGDCFALLVRYREHGSPASLLIVGSSSGGVCLTADDPNATTFKRFCYLPGRKRPSADFEISALRCRFLCRAILP